MTKSALPFKDRSQDTVIFFRNSGSLKSRILYLLLFSETAMVRLWMAWASVGWGFVLLNSTLDDHLALKLMYSLAPSELWALGFFINAIALLYGAVFKRVHKWSIFLEPILGLCVWGMTALSHFQAQGSIGPIFFGAIIYFWLLVRFPTLRERKRERNLANGI